MTLTFTVLESLPGTEDNTASVILCSIGGEEVARDTTANILDETEFREFWIHWSSAHIRVGRGGFVGTDQIMEWVAPIVPIHAIGMTTDEFVEGTWIHGNITGELFLNIY